MHDHLMLVICAHRESPQHQVLIPEPIPELMYQCPSDPPEYSEAARASPLPSYDDVIYCDQVARSFQNLISVK
ncbi:hypothetical protein ANCCEY_10668 [Ancylostoma ceylanicum]|uniref:Uncharacterized protein n=1 Tax=Ancylostoma ceylanicum TaxID=53326 RepID=A0A0D6LGD8_9BILA|nr:hypothetical protein ANCCEY_10668 [Ancylostoma ceylanicum]